MTDHKLIDDCFRPGAELLRHDLAVALLRERLSPIAITENVALADAGGRILAQHAVGVQPGAGPHQRGGRRLRLRVQGL